MGMFKRTLAFVLVVSALCGGSVHGKKQTAKTRPVPVAPYGGAAVIYNNPIVVKQFETAWEADGNGTLRNGTWEYGFRIDYVDGKIVLGELVMGDAERHITIMTYPQTIAIAHVHPYAGVSTPSQLDMDGTYPDYVISRDGLCVTNPKTHTYQKLKPFNQMFTLAHPPRKHKG